MSRFPYLLACACAVAVAGSGSGAEPSVVEHGPRGSKKVALTFDACPTSRENEYDEKVVEVLVREQVPATLFLSGRWVEKNAQRTKELAGNPLFELANHAYWHPHMLEQDDERVLGELKRTQHIIRKATGRKPKYFRPPFGEVDERVARLAEQAGLVTVQYDVASGDPDAGLSAKRIARAVVSEARGGSIIVFHMNGNGPRTAEALPLVIRGLREKGFELVTVGEMLKTTDTGTGEKKDTGMRRRGDKGKQNGQGMVTTATATVSAGSPSVPVEILTTSASSTTAEAHSSPPPAASAGDK